MESSHDFKASLCRAKLINLTLKGLNGSLKVSTMVVFYHRENGERNERLGVMNSEERERKFSTLGTKVGPTILSPF